MSAAVCGSKRSFFEELATATTSPPVSKKRRCSSSSPIRFSPLSPSTPSPVDHLRAVFPNMDIQLLERALDECGNDIDSALKSLHQLCLATSAKENSSSAEESDASMEKGTVTTDGDDAASQNPAFPLPVDGMGWVDLFVREMMGATSVDDARSRATRVLEILEKSISARASAEATQSFHKENVMLKEQIEVLIRENSILKRAVAIQHERQKEYDDKNQELQHLKQLVSQYQEQLRTLEVKDLCFYNSSWFQSFSPQERIDQRIRISMV
ncbi:hypothetical protein L1049_004194 [Liquidambar formosana]|uniref:CUE domain-containing protein n=1 Tax=Liquidambar formosana TaxID=63359 RepID=A0AAP0RRV3_LIQFO